MKNVDKIFTYPEDINCFVKYPFHLDSLIGLVENGNCSKEYITSRLKCVQRILKKLLKLFDLENNNNYKKWIDATEKQIELGVWCGNCLYNLNHCKDGCKTVIKKIENGEI